VVTSVHFFNDVAFSGSYDGYVNEWDLKMVGRYSHLPFKGKNSIRSLQADRYKVVVGPQQTQFAFIVGNFVTIFLKERVISLRSCSIC